MSGWYPLAAMIVVEEVLLRRMGRPLLSHDSWAACDTRRGRAFVSGSVATLTVHLRFRFNWPRSLAFGAAVGVLDLLLPTDRKALP